MLHNDWKHYHLAIAGDKNPIGSECKNVPNNKIWLNVLKKCSFENSETEVKFQ